MGKNYTRVALDDGTGVSFIDRIAGQVQISNDAGATFAPPGGSTAFGALGIAQARALALCGASVDSCSWSEFDNDQWYASAIVTSGTVALTLDAGGVVQLDSGATASSRGTIIAHGSSAAALALVGNQQASRWYVRGRLQVPTAVDAQSSCGIWLSLHDFTNPYVFFGVLGSVSAANFIGQVVNNGGTTVNTVSAVAIDTNWHTFEMWNDGVNVSFAIDGVVVGTQPIANLGTGTGAPYAWASNGTTAASRKLKLDKLFYFFPGQ